MRSETLLHQENQNDTGATGITGRFVPERKQPASSPESE